MSERKRDIVIWDDAGFLMHKPDTLEKIREDFIKLFEEYANAPESPELFFISIVGINKRLERLEK